MTCWIIEEGTSEGARRNAHEPSGLVDPGKGNPTPTDQWPPAQPQHTVVLCAVAQALGDSEDL